MQSVDQIQRRHEATLCDSKLKYWQAWRMIWQRLGKIMMQERGRSSCQWSLSEFASCSLWSWEIQHSSLEEQRYRRPIAGGPLNPLQSTCCQVGLGYGPALRPCWSDFLV
ncbi:hypothetical protein PAXRUDRAFT_431766 [Paxillus rubicundulus Ve08.2h10]|uniref:Uncharacterized protein n=1 Tax=Paxillus rubicundulus Ve08.2h10 TaxID=930991 RepID=A0A0D0DQI0_9AGAM|nr:hypothetical protein PAXRUDRAFT_431766 [Paxillus rubicundulus Ve08.2h10]